MKKRLVLIVIAVLFALVTGHAILTVYCNIDADDGGYTFSIYTNGNEIDRDWDQGNNYVDNPPTADYFSCSGNRGRVSDYDADYVDPWNDFYFSLDLVGQEPIPDPLPNNE